MTRNLRTLRLALPLTLALLGIAPPGADEPPAPAEPPAAVEPARAPSRLANYEPDRAGHPLRIAAYALHPVGVILDYLIFRPAYWLGSHEPIRTLVGFDD